jgi:hypothetical protein
VSLRGDLLQPVKDIAAARAVGEDLFVRRTQGWSGVGDRAFGVQATILQRQQAHPPGGGVAIVFEAQQEAIGGQRLNADQHGLTGLEDLSERSDLDAAQVDSLVMLPGARDRGVDDVEDRAQGDPDAEYITQEFGDAAHRTVADQHEGADQLPQELLGHGQVKQHLVIRLLRGKRLVGGLIEDVGLPVDELAADVELVRQVGDGFRPGQRLKPDLEPLAGRQGLGGTAIGNCLLDRQDGGRLSAAGANLIANQPLVDSLPRGWWPVSSCYSFAMACLRRVRLLVTVSSMTDLQFVRTVRETVGRYLAAHIALSLREKDLPPMAVHFAIATSQEEWIVDAKLHTLRQLTRALRSKLRGGRMDELAVACLKTSPGKYGSEFLDDLRDPKELREIKGALDEQYLSIRDRFSGLCELECALEAREAEDPALPAALPPHTNEAVVAQYVSSAKSPHIEEAVQVTSLSLNKIQRTQAWKNFEEQNLERYLIANRRASGEDVMRKFGFSPAKTVKMKAWKDHMGRRKAAKPPPQIKEQPLSARMLESRPDEQAAKPSALAQRQDSFFREIVEASPPAMRGKLNKLTPAECNAFTAHLHEQIPLDCLVGLQLEDRMALLVEVTGTWLDELDQEHRRHSRQDRR